MEPRSLSRRRLLSIAGTIGLATPALSGCLGWSGTAKGATDVVVHNEAGRPVAVRVTVRDAGADRPRIDQRLRLEANARATPTASDKLPVGADYVVSIDVEDGPVEVHRWEDVSLDLAPLHVIVDGSTNVVFALEVG